MKIEIWSDFVCPFCYIGKRKLEEALSGFPDKDQVEIEFKSFQLDPNASLYTGQDFYESMAIKFGSVEQAKQMTAAITEQAKLVGLDFRFDTMKPTNTYDAHRLTKFATEQGKGAVLSEKLLYANFTESKDVGNIEVLAEIAEAAGLEKEAALAVLQNTQAYEKEVHTDIAEARQFGITGVPFFILNRKYAISGAQPTETFVQALDKVWKEEKSTPTFESLVSNTGTDAACADGSCAISEQNK